MYSSNSDLPFVCRLNLPEAAQKVYRDAFNRVWRQTAESPTRFRAAQDHAWTEVRKKFEREKETGRWVPKATQLEARVSSSQAAKKRAAR